MDIRRTGESSDQPNKDAGGNNTEQGQGGSNTKGGGGGSSIVGPLLTILILVILAVGGIYYFGDMGGSSTGTPSSTSSGPVATVGGQDISGDQFNQQLTQLREATTSQAQQFQSLSETRQQELILSSLINQELIRQAADNAGVSVSSSDVDSRLQSQVQQIGGESEFEQRLSDNDLTREEVRENLRQQMQISQYVSQNVNAPSDSEIQQAYDQLPEQRLRLLGQAVNRNSSGTSTQGTPSLSDVRPVLERQLTAQKQQQARQQLLQQARNSIDVEVLLDGVSYPPTTPQSQGQPQAQPGANAGSQQVPSGNSGTQQPAQTGTGSTAQ